MLIITIFDDDIEMTTLGKGHMEECGEVNIKWEDKPKIKRYRDFKVFWRKTIKPFKNRRFKIKFFNPNLL